MKLDPVIHIAMHSVLSLKPGVTEERQKEWLAMAAEVSGWRQSRGRLGKAGASAWAIGSIPRAYAGNRCPPKPDITVQKALQHLVDYQKTHMGSAQF